MSQDHNLLESFRQDKDVHRRTAAVAFGVAEQDVTGEMRMSAKRINFGIVYGLSSFGLSKDLGIPVAKAQRFIDAYFATYPGVKKYMQEQIEFAREHGFVKTIFGRRRYLPEIRDKNMAVRQFAQRQAINTPIQGSASDLIKLAMAGLQAEIDAAGLPYEMFLQVHDELLFNVPKAKVTEAAVLIRKGMENVISLSVPVKVDIAAGGNWAQMRAV
jgi:DNA polymerase-1